MIVVCRPADGIERLICQAQRKSMQSDCAPAAQSSSVDGQPNGERGHHAKAPMHIFDCGAYYPPFSFPANSQSPTLRVDPYWPRPLPNNWIIGQVGGIYVDAQDNIWVFQRPRSVTDDEKAAAFDPPRAKCCVPAPSVLVFNQAGDVVKSWGGLGDNPGYDWPLQEHGILV